MKRRIVVGGIMVLVLGLTTVPARAQTTVEGVVVYPQRAGMGHMEVGAQPAAAKDAQVRSAGCLLHLSSGGSYCDRERYAPSGRGLKREVWDVEVSSATDEQSCC